MVFSSNRRATKIRVKIFLFEKKIMGMTFLKLSITVKSRAVDRSTIQFWTLLAKGQSA